jgi:hypothetical protein
MGLGDFVMKDTFSFERSGYQYPSCQSILGWETSCHWDGFNNKQASQVQPAHPVKGAEGKRAASCQRWIFMSLSLNDLKSGRVSTNLVHLSLRCGPGFRQRPLVKLIPRKYRLLSLLDMITLSAQTIGTKNMHM